MAGYSIFILNEGDLTISGGVGLDGVTQGDGSHLVGQTITLNSNNWTEVPITDNDDNFQDNDGSQRLDGAAEIDGITYSSGTRVEAEYGLTLTDGTDFWTVVGFNVSNSNPSFGTIEGLAFIGPEGGFPPVGVPLTVTAAQEGPNFAAADYAFPICFTAGTEIAVPGGTRRVEALRPGDLVLTRFDGPQPVRWIGQRLCAAEGPCAPILFKPGAIGNTAPLRLSRQHRLRYSGWRAELFLGEEAVLIPAAHFVNGDSVVEERGGTVTYVHLMFDRHQIVLAEGVETESFHPGPGGLRSLSRAARDELLSLFPDMPHRYGPTIHRVAQRAETQVLLAS